MQKSIEPGARILTTSGMYATVVEVTDDGVVLEIAPGVEAEFVNQAILRVVQEDELEEEEDEGDEETVEDDAPVTEVEAKDTVTAEAETPEPADGKVSDKPSA